MRRVARGPQAERAHARAHRRATLALTSLALTSLLGPAGGAAVAAGAQTAAERAVGAPAPGSPAPTAPATAPAKPVSGRMRLALVGIGGRFAFALTSDRIEVRGTVTPYVPGQRVRVHFYRDGRLVAGRTATIVRERKHHRVGTFAVSYRSARGGVVRVVAYHEPSSRMGLFAAGTQSFPVISGHLASGARGDGVRTLQRALGALHYAVPQSGYFDEATADAVIAFRKMTGLPRVGYADPALFHALQRGEGGYRVRFPWDGRHIEADLGRQVLAEVGKGGRVENIYPTSSGKPSTPTVVGHFRVYMKTPGYNSERMLDSSYFTGGYAVHGYFEVPAYAASHGCLRVPELDAPALYGWMTIGTIVDVYP